MKRKFLIVDEGEAPDCTKKIARYLRKSWKSPGGVTLMISECDEGHWHFICCPSLREFVGGKRDGARIYPRFALNIGRFVAVFDNNPKVIFDSAQDGNSCIMFVGDVDGINAHVAIFAGPVVGQPPAELDHKQGPKKGTIEPNNFPREDSDAADSE
jgi:hypothetical protein